LTLGFRLKQLFRKFSHICHVIRDTECNIETAITEPKAMPAADRVKSEFKAAAGLIGGIAGCVEGNPVAIICSTGSLGEGLYDLDRAGHMYHIRHRQPKSKVA